MTSSAFGSPTFGALLRQLRKRAGMTQADLAAAVGYSVSFICDLEQDRRLPAVPVVRQQFVPALGLQDEARFAAQLVELAALARGERPPVAPAAVTVERMSQPAVVTVSAWPSRLPAPPSAIIGRKQEVEAVCARLQEHSGRLLTLVGPPGVGKTRLALAVAARLEPLYRDGARFVPLAAVDDPELVAVTLANALELPDSGKQPPQARLIAGLRRQELLLALDNFEQLLPAAQLLAALLAECHGLHLLVTSRERLHLRAEQRFPVSPLALDAAAALFIQRSQAVDPAFAPDAAAQAVVQAICTRLDCLPLAIELIAARIDLFTPRRMLADLEGQALNVLVDGPYDLPEHQRTLRTAIQYSYHLLTERERALFRSLGAFVDGFDRAILPAFGFDAATLQGLVDKSLVRPAPCPAPGNANAEAGRRFLLLETLREYAREQLLANAEAEAVQRQHAAYYVQLLESTESNLHGAQVTAWLERLETEHNNLRAALKWAVKSGDAETALRLCAVLQWFWDRHGHVHEGQLWLQMALACAGDAFAAGHPAHTIHKPPRYVPQVRHFYFGLGNLAVHEDDDSRARLHYEQALLGRRACGDKTGMADLLPGVTAVAFRQGDYTYAVACCEELLLLAEELKDRERAAQASLQLGRILIRQGEVGQASHYLDQSCALAQELYLPSLLASVLACQGDLALGQKDYARARRRYCQSLQIAHQLRDTLELATGLASLADVACTQADAEGAATLLAAAGGLAAQSGAPLPAADQPHWQRIVATARAQLGATAYARACAAGLALSAAGAVAYALALG